MVDIKINDVDNLVDVVEFFLKKKSWKLYYYYVYVELREWKIEIVTIGSFM